MVGDGDRGFGRDEEEPRCRPLRGLGSDEKASIEVGASLFHIPPTMADNMVIAVMERILLILLFGCNEDDALAPGACNLL